MIKFTYEYNIFEIIFSLIIILFFYNYFIKKQKEKFSLNNDLIIFYINLNKRKDRKKKCIKELNKASILKGYKRYSAIDGKKIKNSDLLKYTKNLTEFPDYKRGWIGCAQSHINLWELCIKYNKNMLIFEDDVILKDQYNKNMLLSVKNLPTDFDIIYYQTVSYVKYEKYNKLYYKLKDKNFLLINYLISPVGAEKLIRYIKPYDPSNQIDTYIVKLTKMGYLNAFLYKLPTVYTIQDFNESNVQKSSNQYVVHDFHK